MASTPTTAKQPRIVHLKYNADGSVTSRPPSPVKFQKDEWVTFVSDTGGDVYVNLNPAAYNPPVFSPTSGPIQVTIAPSGVISKAPCGFVTDENGEKVGYGWLPDPVKQKLNIKRPSDGIETEP